MSAPPPWPCLQPARACLSYIFLPAFILLFFSSSPVLASGALSISNSSTSLSATMTHAHPPSDPIHPGMYPNVAEEYMTDWLSAFNTADKSTILAFHESHNFPYSVCSRDIGSINDELSLARATGGFDIIKQEAQLEGLTHLHTPPTEGEQMVNTIVFTTLLKEKQREEYAKATICVKEGMTGPRKGGKWVSRFEINPTITPDEFLSPKERKEYQRARKLLDAAMRKKIVKRIAKIIKKEYIIPELAVQMAEALKSKLEKGQYEEYTEGESFAKKLLGDIKAVSNDEHIHLQFAPPYPPGKKTDQTPGEFLKFAEAEDFGFGELEWMDGNIAFLPIYSFFPTTKEQVGGSPEAFRKGIGSKMSAVGDANGLILDLRENHGGHPDGVSFMLSYLFDKKTHVNDMFNRKGREEEFWTGAVPGLRYGGSKPIYVLISKDTISGGEEMAYDLQCLKRATLVGQTTAGAANPVRKVHNVIGGDKGWWKIGVPDLRPVNPVTGDNWEGVGVVPDVKLMREEEDARAVAYRMIKQVLKGKKEGKKEGKGRDEL